MRLCMNTTSLFLPARLRLNELGIYPAQPIDLRDARLLGPAEQGLPHPLVRAVPTQWNETHLHARLQSLHSHPPRQRIPKSSSPVVRQHIGINREQASAVAH